MSKDPAFLFYSSDFLTGTMTMTNEQVGIYIRLLCLQHQQGILYENDMIFICKSFDAKIYSKFIKTDEGYYNERLKIESEKRSNYCKSRGKNKEGKIKIENISKSYDFHMENENENINEDIIINKSNKFIIPEISEIKEYCFLRKNNVDAEIFYNFYQSKGWMVGKSKMKDWKACIHTWEKSNNNQTNNSITNGKKRNNVDSAAKLAGGYGEL